MKSSGPLALWALIGATLASSPALAETLVTPAVAIDAPSDDRAESAQGQVLVAGDGVGTLVAAWYDARDARVHAATVEGETAGESRGSLTLDPAVRLDDADLAGTAGGFLLVWSDAGAIRGQRLSVVAGEVEANGAPFDIVSDAGSYSHPRAAFGSCEWLVAFRRDVADTGPIRTACVGRDGGAPLLSSSDLVASAGDFDVAATPDGALYALSFVDTSASPVIRVALANLFGVVSSAQLSDATVDSLTELATAADAAGGRTVWFEPGGALYGRGFDADLTLREAADLLLSGEAASVERAALTAGTQTWVAWVEGGALSARRWRDPLDPVAALEASGVDSVALASAGLRRLMTYSAFEVPGGGDVFTRRLSGTTPNEALALTVGTGPREAADLVAGGAGLVAVWSQPGRAATRDVWLREIDADGLPVGPLRPVAGTPADEASPAAASGPDAVVVSWVEDGGALLARRFAAGDLSVADADATVVCDGATGAGSPSAAVLGAQGDRFVVAVESAATGELLLASLDGLPSAANPSCVDVLAGGATTVSAPRLATPSPADGTALAAWIAGDPGSRAVEARPIATDGALGATVMVVDSAEDVAAIALVGLGGGEWLLASERPDGVDGGSDVVLTRFTADGTVLGEDALAAPVGALDAAPALVASDGGALLVWRRGASPGTVRSVQYDGAQIVTATEVEVTGDVDLIGGPLAVGGVSIDEAVVLAREHDRAPVRDDERLIRRLVRHDLGPVADAGGPYGGLEGDEVDLDGTASVALANSAIVSWGWDLGGVPASGQVVTQALPDNGLLPVTLTVTDGLGRSGVDLVFADVENVAPAVVLGDFSRVFVEGTEQAYTAIWDDPGLDEQVVLSWDFGDGRVEEGPAGELAALDHLYEQGSYTLSVRAFDKDGGVSPFDVASISVLNGEPTVVLGPISAIDEGGTALALFGLDDPGGDPLDVEIDWDDGQQESLEGVLEPYPTQLSHLFLDDDSGGFASPYLVCVIVTDDDGSSDEDCEQVTVSNVAPVIEGTPPPDALEGVFAGPDPVPYEAELTIVDPGDDELSTSLDTDGLPGVTLTLSPDGRAASVSFVPTLDLWRLRQPPAWDFTLASLDDDGDDTAILVWKVTIIPRDDDADGLPDTCRDAFGVMGGPDDDDDDDGATNFEECLGGTDPTVDNRPPEAPVINAPDDGSEVATRLPVLSVKNITSSGVQLDYEFEIYRGPELFEEDRVDEAVVPEGDGIITQWRTGTLTDRQTYWWRARALSGEFAGPWMDVATFTVVLPNDPPGLAAPLSPEGEVETQLPTFVWTNATDPDGDSIRYRLELYGDEDLTDRVLLVDDVAQFLGSETTEYELGEDEALADNTSFWWRLTAFDARGGVGLPSGALPFRVNTANDLPGQPTLVAPDDGAILATNHPELVVTAVEDLDGDELTYSFVVSPDEDFQNIVESIRTVVAGEDDLVRHEVARDLQEDTLYYWRAAARDHRGLGPFVQGTFTVNQGNNAPRPPTIQAPSQGQLVGTATPDLVLRNTVDPEGDAVTYDFEVHDRPTMDSLVFSVYGVEEGEGEETTVTVDEPLPDGETYHFRARGVDELEAVGAWSPTTQFTVRVAPEGLDAPRAVSPVGGEAVTADAVELVVENAEGVAQGEVTYTFEVYGDQQLNNRVYRVEGIPETRDTTAHLVADPLPPETYWWHARAVDDAGESPWSATATFVIEDVTAGDGADMGADADAGLDGGGGVDVGDADGGGGGGGDECGCGSAGGPLPPADVLALALLVGVGLRRSRRKGPAL